MGVVPTVATTASPDFGEQPLNRTRITRTADTSAVENRCAEALRFTVRLRELLQTDG